jgi:hypothetical protein
LSGFKAWGALIALIAAGSLVTACGGGADTRVRSDRDASNSANSPAPDQIPEIEVHALWALGDAKDVPTLLGKADVVFRGKVVAFKGLRPSLSQPGGSAPEAPPPRSADLPVSQFEVRVESVLSGTVPTETVVLEQIGGVQTRPDGTRVRIGLEGDERIHVGQKYLFFASFQEDGSVVASPFGRMKVRQDGSLVAESGWEHLGAMTDLSRRKLEDAEREISTASRE